MKDSYKREVSANANTGKGWNSSRKRPESDAYIYSAPQYNGSYKITVEEWYMMILANKIILSEAMWTSQISIMEAKEQLNKLTTI